MLRHLRSLATVHRQLRAATSYVNGVYSSGLPDISLAREETLCHTVLTKMRGFGDRVAMREGLDGRQIHFNEMANKVRFACLVVRVS